MNNKWDTYNKNNQDNNIPKNNQKEFKNKDTSVDKYDELYGNYVRNDLLPQISRLAALKLTSNPLSFSIETKENSTNKFFLDRIDDIFSNIDLDRIVFLLEEKLSREANGVLVFEKIDNEEYRIYVPTTTITKLEPSSGALIYLQIIRYSEIGNLINVVSEIHTLEKTSYEFREFDSQESANDYMSGGANGGEKISEEDYKKNNPNEKDKDFSESENTLGWIQAVYFENIPTIDGRGEADINLNSKYVELLNKTMVRFHWELDFNKSKFIEQEELGNNPFSSTWNQKQNQSMIENNFVKKTNSFGLSLGSAGSAYQYFETTNQNMVNLIYMFNYFVKKLWEQSGQHQSGSDIGKQISDFQATQEKGSEHLRFGNKALRRKYMYRELMWRMFLTMDDGEFGGYGKVPKGLKKKNINFNMSYAKIEIEEIVIKNEIMKIQANLTDRETAIARITPLSPNTDIMELAAKYLERNQEDIVEQQFDAKPIQPNDPSINNVNNKENNQAKKFNTQKIDKEEKSKT